MSERASHGRCRRAEPPFVQSLARPTRRSKRALFAMPGDSSSRMKDKSFSTRSAPHCSSRTSITLMDSSATRFTPTPRSFRAACTLRASPARTATTPTHRNSALPATLSAPNATRPATFDTSAHHHHAAGSKGAECTACHMPTTNYMVVDPRHDHSMRIPRPDRTLSLGTPNACNQCHADKTPSWASEAIKSWYPSPKLGYQGFAEAFDLADRAAPGAQAALTTVVEDTSQSAIARASAVARLGPFLSPKSLAVIAQAVKDSDAKVRMGAIAALANAGPLARLTLLAPLLADEARIVRMDAARGLAGAPEQHLSSEDRTRFESAIAEYIAGQRFNAERPEAQVNLANLYLARGQGGEAEAALLKAIEIDPSFVPAPITLAELRRSQGQESERRDHTSQRPRTKPKFGCVAACARTLTRAPEANRGGSQELERSREAGAGDAAVRLTWPRSHCTTPASRPRRCKSSPRRLPVIPMIAKSSTLLRPMSCKSGQFESALSHANLLHELEPEDQQVNQLLATIRQSMGK